MKKVEIKIGGTGHEITRSKFTCEEIKKVKDYCKEHNKDIESVLTNELEEILDDRGYWYDCDDLGHFMGGHLSCKLYVTINEDEYEFESTDAKIELKSDDYPIIDDGVIISFITLEKGILNTWEFEIKDDAEFDITKLKLIVKQIETTDSYFELIQELYYDNEPLNGDGFTDTDGKAFYVEIEECNEDE